MMLGKEEDRKPIGLFFGSFNPIHNGHVGIARYLLEKKLCAEVWFVVSPCNPFKVDRFLLLETDRFAIVSAAIRGIPGMKACDVEFSMSKPSYTVDTLRVLFDRYPGRQFALIIGGDNVPDFPKWKDHRWIEGHCDIFVYPRLGIITSIEGFTNMTFVDAPLFPLSATEIREMIRKGDDISSLVPSEALSLIWKLYSK